MTCWSSGTDCVHEFAQSRGLTDVCVVFMECSGEQTRIGRCIYNIERCSYVLDEHEQKNRLDRGHGKGIKPSRIEEMLRCIGNSWIESKQWEG